MEDREINLVDYWNIIWKKRKLIIACVLIISIVAAIISLLLPKWYKATTVIMPPAGEQGQLGGLSANLSSFGLGGILGGGEDQMRIIAILKSKKMLELLDEKYNLQTKYNTKFKFQTYDILRSNLRISLGEEEQISVSLFDKDQDMVGEMTNFIVHSLDSINIAFNTSKANNNRIFVENRINIAMDSLSFYENKTTQFMEANDIISLSEQLKAEIEKASDMQTQIMAKEVELDVMKIKLKSDNQAITNLGIDLRYLKEKYQEIFEPSDSNKLFINLNNAPNIQKQFAQLQRKVLYFSKLLEYLGPQYEQAKIEEARDITTIQVIDKAKRPEWKSKPKRAYIVIIAFVLSLAISIIGIIISQIYLIDQKTRSDI